MPSEESHPNPEAGPLERLFEVALHQAAEFLFPQPGQQHNPSAIPVSDAALAALLAQAQVGMALNRCQVPECENCNAHRLIWWDCCNALDRATRLALQAWLNAEGYGLPEAPWEDVDFYGNPTQPPVAGPRA